MKFVIRGIKHTFESMFGERLVRLPWNSISWNPKWAASRVNRPNWANRGTVNVNGTKFRCWSGHDFSLSQRAELVVTSKALETLRQYNLNYYDVTPLKE